MSIFIETDRSSAIPCSMPRINDAEADIAFANNEISKIPAFTYEGLVIKAEAIKASGVFEAAKRGVAMEVALLLQQIIDIGGRVLA